jgi:hypothetical protein
VLDTAQDLMTEEVSDGNENKRTDVTRTEEVCCP